MIKVAIVGVGNAASSFFQGLQYYRWVGDDWTKGWEEHKKSGRPHVPGLIHTKIGDYYPKDIKIVAAFDITDNKVGMDLGKAVFNRPNNTRDLLGCDGYVQTEVRVRPAPLLDARQGSDKIVTVEANHKKIAEDLKELEVDVIVNYLPATSEVATRFWADVAIEAGCAFINCTITRIAQKVEFRERFRQAGLPLFGDDLKGQIGATILHRWLVKLCQMQGVRIDRTSGVVVAGNTDIYNLLENRPLIKPVQSSLGSGVADWVAHAGPSDYISWLLDRKWAYIYIEGRAFGDAPFKMETKLEIWNGPSGAAAVMDLVRLAAIVKVSDGAEKPVCALYMKAPPQEMNEYDAHTEIDRLFTLETS